MSTDKKITGLPVAASISASDVSVLVSSDTDYQYTFTVLLQFLQNNVNTGANISFGTTLPQNTSGKNGDVFVNTSAGSFAQKVSGTWLIVYTLPAASAADGALLYGTGLPGAGRGKNTDSYINTLTGIFYKKSADTWSQVFSMATGPQGPQGTAGTNGTSGTDGNTILFGTTNPSNTLTGIDGNFYINTSNYTLFGPKTAGAWGDSVSLLAPGLPDGGIAGQVLMKVDETDFNTEWRDNSFANISGEPGDNANLGIALDAKQDELGFTPENAANKNTANGYAGLDGSGKVAAAQLPSYVDDVLEFADFAALPATGETGKIYVTLDTNAEYRWSGSTYIQIVASPGSTDAVAEGTTNLYFTAGRALTTLLTGIGFSSATAVTASDTILGAIGKLQAQVTGLFKIPAGGTAMQVLAKASGIDGDTEWINATVSGAALMTFVASGTNTYIATIDPAITSYETTQIFSIMFTHENTGISTLNLNSLGAVYIVKNGNADLVAGDIIAGSILLLAYDGVNFQIVGNLSGVLPTITSGEKVITITSAGAQKNYDLQDQVVSSSDLSTADFSTGIAGVAGYTGQVAYDSNYRYDCIGANQWRRSPLNGELVDLYLTDIDDSAGDWTNFDLESEYPNSLPGQQIWGINTLYIKKTPSLWKKITQTNA